MKKTTKVNKNFTNRCTVAPNIEWLGPKSYRARVTLNGKRHSNIVTSLTAANKWLKMAKTAGKV